MPHNEHLFPAGQTDDRTVPSPGKLRQIDQRASESINIIDGGVWAPEKKIWIGGAGVVLNNGCLQDATIETGRGAVGLLLGDGRYPTHSNGDAQKKTVTIPIGGVDYQLGSSTTIFLFGVPITTQQPIPLQRVRNPNGLKCTVTAQAFVPFLVPLPQLRVHNGALITQLRITMRFAQSPLEAELLNASTVYARLIRYPVADDVAGNIGLPPSVTNDFDLYIIPPFQAATPYQLNDVVIPSPSNGGVEDRQYRCITAGLSGPTSGGWSETLCDVVTSNFAQFRVEPRPPDTLGSPPVPFITQDQDKHHYATLPYQGDLTVTAAAQFRNGLPFDLVITPNRINTIDTDNYAYAVEIISPGSPGPIFHSVSWDLDLITTMKEP